MKSLTTEEFIKRSNIVHKWKYTYSNTAYKNNKEDVCITCPIHGDFWQRPSNHLKGCGCPKCNSGNNTPKPIGMFIKQANGIHKGKYIYNKSHYINNNEKICITCTTHGDFWQSPIAHLRGEGCPKCGIEQSIIKQKRTQEEFIDKCNIVHNHKYIYDNTVYINSKTKVCITCPIHGDFWQIADNHLCGHGCPLCGNIMSNKETEIYEFCKGIDKNTEIRNRILLNNKEIDIYCPSKDIGIEFNGLYWHSEHFKKDAKYCHLNKTLLCESIGIKLIQIFEDEWIDKPNIIKSYINKLLDGKTEKFQSDSCYISKISEEEATEFLKTNHIKGKCRAKYYFGLRHNDDLVSLMVFDYDCDNNYKLIRFCDKLNTSVHNSSFTILNYFIQLYHPNKITAYSDNRWNNKEFYINLGFKECSQIEPNYYYVVGNHRETKEVIPFKELAEKGIYRIYDCGTTIFELDLDC